MICLGLCDQYFTGNRYVYPVTIGMVAVTSVVYSMEKVLQSFDISLGAVGQLFHIFPLYSQGTGWVAVALAGVALSLVLGAGGSNGKELSGSEA